MKKVKIKNKKNGKTKFARVIYRIQCNLELMTPDPNTDKDGVASRPRL